MNFLTHNCATDAQWDGYRQLECIPEAVPNPARDRTSLISGLNVFWRPLLSLLIDELIEEQRVDYLNRCWSLDAFGQSDRSSPNSLQRLWVLME